MDVAAARSALAEVGLATSRIEPILGGWSSWTFDVDGEWVVRFPRNPEVAAATHRELALLAELAQRVSFQIPEPAYRGTWQTLPVFAYRRINGRPITAADTSPEVLDGLARMLRELHTFPVDRAAELLGTGPPQSAWRQHFENLWSIVEYDALPALDTTLADRVRVQYAHFVDTASDLPYCLVHNDLGPEHVLLSDTPAVPVGIIDFEDSWIGDPAVDLLPLVTLLGAHTLDALISPGDLRDGLGDRMWFYSWMTSIHHIIYGTRNNMEHERRQGIADLRRRIAAPRTRLAFDRVQTRPTTTNMRSKNPQR